MADTLRRSPLDARHRALEAKMGAFAGWDMPVAYSGTIAEHRAVRTSAGLFDVSHLGKLIISGTGAAALLDEVLSNRFADLGAGRARYTLMLNDDAGIVDDLIVYSLDGRFLAVPNAANVDEVRRRMRGVSAAAAVESPSLATIAVQGPASRAIVEARFPFAAGLGYMRCAADGDLVVARSGYTGEVGYEVFGPEEEALAAWDDLLDAVERAGGRACGLGARDTLRLEMGYPLHGNDIDPVTTAREAGLQWAVAEDKKDFVGRDAHLLRAPRTMLVGLRMEDRLIPRRGCAVISSGRQIGTVTSGTFSPTLRIGIALAAVTPEAAGEGGAVEVDVRGTKGTARVVSPPFVERSPKG